MLTSGLLGFVGGAVAGGAVGYAIERAAGPCGEYFCGVAGTFYGGLAGTAAAVPLAVHLANDRRGHYGYGLLVSTAATAAGILLGGALSTTDLEQRAFLVGLAAVPVLQLTASILVERHTAGRDVH